MEEFFSLKSKYRSGVRIKPITPSLFINYIKNKMNPKVDKYLVDGCMRCKYGGTPKCKVNNWLNELEELRKIVIKSGLIEELKWGMPCYTFNNKNILMIIAFKEYACISFFKGILLEDKEKLLMAHGENSQSVRMIKYTDSKHIIRQTSLIKSYIKEAIGIENSGRKVTFNKNPEPIPEELMVEFNKDLKFKNAFHELTPGRQRGYIIYFSQPKGTQSKINRIEKYRENILKGKGLNDRQSN
jgi:uncharacterized protein YdeI (YjbR/CyaY-like superfamily)